jgi:acetaldehyde dehydrogenase (acetylating)
MTLLQQRALAEDAALDDDLTAIAEARALATQARAAFEHALNEPQETLDRWVAAMAAAGTDAAEELARLAVDETGYGVYEHKIIKNRFNTVHVAEWMSTLRCKGVLWRDERAGVLAVGEPMGPVAAIIPVTNPTSTVLFKCLAAVKSGNSVVCSPHPRAVGCCRRAAEIVAAAATDAGAPPGMISCLTRPVLAATRELMEHPAVALVLATGGSEMVRAAYSCGKPTLAVGPGNAPAYIHRSVGSAAQAAAMIVASKSFDNGTACVAEQAVVVDADVAGEVEAAFISEGTAFLKERDALALGRLLLTPDRRINPKAVGQSADRLAEMCGFTVPGGTKVLAAWLDDVGPDVPLSLEKLAPVLAFYRTGSVDDGERTCREVLAHGGQGHTLTVHAEDPEVVGRFAALPASRILINCPALFGGMGYSAALDPSFMLGTGTWGGSVVSDNVTPLHLINIKRVAAERRPWRELFAAGS